MTLITTKFLPDADVADGYVALVDLTEDGWSVAARSSKNGYVYRVDGAKALFEGALALGELGSKYLPKEIRAGYSPNVQAHARHYNLTLPESLTLRESAPDPVEIEGLYKQLQAPIPAPAPAVTEPADSDTPFREAERRAAQAGTTRQQVARLAEELTRMYVESPNEYYPDGNIMRPRVRLSPARTPDNLGPNIRGESIVEKDHVPVPPAKDLPKLSDYTPAGRKPKTSVRVASWVHYYAPTINGVGSIRCAALVTSVAAPRTDEALVNLTFWLPVGGNVPAQNVPYGPGKVGHWSWQTDKVAE